MFMQRYFSKVNKYIVLFNLMYILAYCKVNDLLKVQIERVFDTYNVLYFSTKL